MLQRFNESLFNARENSTNHRWGSMFPWDKYLKTVGLFRLYRRSMEFELHPADGDWVAMMMETHIDDYLLPEAVQINCYRKASCNSQVVRQSCVKFDGKHNKVGKMRHFVLRLYEEFDSCSVGVSSKSSRFMIGLSLQPLSKGAISTALHWDALRISNGSELCFYMHVPRTGVDTSIEHDLSFIFRRKNGTTLRARITNIRAAGHKYESGKKVRAYHAKHCSSLIVMKDGSSRIEEHVL